jgi:prevent-host-death family protein
MEVTVQEAKTQLSRLLRRVQAGEDVIIRRGREPVAVLTRITGSEVPRQIWGDLDGRLAADFDDLPDDFAGYA